MVILISPGENVPCKQRAYLASKMRNLLADYLFIFGIFPFAAQVGYVSVVY